MIIESEQEKVLIEQLIDVALKAGGRNCLNGAIYLEQQLQKYNKDKNDSGKRTGTEESDKSV